MSRSDVARFIRPTTGHQAHHVTLHLWERQERIRPRLTGKGKPAEYRYWDILAATLVAGLMTMRASKASVASGEQ